MANPKLLHVLPLRLRFSTSLLFSSLCCHAGSRACTPPAALLVENLSTSGLRKGPQVFKGIETKEGTERESAAAVAPPPSAVAQKEGRGRGTATAMEEPTKEVAGGGGGGGDGVSEKEAAAKFRVMFGGTAFPSSASFTRESLKPHPQILVEVVPNEEVANRIHEFDMCVCRTTKITADVISRAERLKVITQFGMGLDGVDIEAATRKGIKVARIPSVGTGNALCCAEHAIYLMFSLLRDQKGMERCLREKRHGQPTGQTLFNKTVLIVGYGNIGNELAPRLKPFGVRILAIRPSWNNKYPLKASSDDNKTATTVGDPDYVLDRKGGMEHLHEFNSQADIVVMCCPLTPQSRGMVNQSFLASMKPGALLVNVARGGLMDYDAVKAALDSGHLGGLGTDVTWVEPMDPQDPIVQYPNVVITPHIAGVTEFSYRIMSKVVATAAVQLSEGKLVTCLDFVN